MADYYVDTCIYLNLWKKEGDASKGKPFWQIAKEFIEKVMFSEDLIYYSGFVLKELMVKLEKDIFEEKKTFFKREKVFEFAKATKDDYDSARRLESEAGYEISFYDCMHVALCKRLNLVLITRDTDLIEFAKNHIEVKRPEELLP